MFENLKILQYIPCSVFFSLSRDMSRITIKNRFYSRNVRAMSIQICMHYAYLCGSQSIGRNRFFFNHRSKNIFFPVLISRDNEFSFLSFSHSIIINVVFCICLYFSKLIIKIALYRITKLLIIYWNTSNSVEKYTCRINFHLRTQRKVFKLNKMH